LRIIFMGTPDFAVPTLDALVGAGHDVALVVAQPSRKSGRGRKLRPPPVAVRATELGLDLVQPRAMRSGPFPDRFCAVEADVAVVIAYGRILPLRLLESPRFGCVNVHASLLPRWRGAAPIQAAVLAGDEVSGVCTQRMEEGLDTGPVYLERRLALDPRETAGTLHDKLARLSAEIAVATVEGLGTIEPVPQSEQGITWAPKIDKTDGRVDWAGDAAAIDRQVRAMSPWPGGFVDGLKLIEVRPVEGEGAPGVVLRTRPLVVACGTGAVELVRVQAPGKRPVSGFDYANGARLAPGETL
jgi:methionyl-tRNA formyltransferase